MNSLDPTDFTPEEIEAARQAARSPGPWYTSEEVRAHLRALEEAEAREGPLNKNRLREVLNEARSRRLS